MREQAKKVHCAPAVKRYIAEISAASRQQPDIELGASPRASMMLLQAAKAYALIRGREYVRPDDIQALAVPVLAHRLSLKAEARLKRLTAEKAVVSLLHTVPVPEK